VIPSTNPLLTLPYEPAWERLGEDYYDIVPAAEFPCHVLRFRNDPLLKVLGLAPPQVSDQHFLQAFGRFEGRSPFLALRYHGYQFGEYNPGLGDGRGFLYGQVRGTDGKLYDFGTKGSGTTPYSRGGDGRLTLKGGIREVIAAEALQALGVRTSRCLSLIETGEQLWRGDEPSPTRSSVMVRFSDSHIRFGTFERLHYFGRKDLIRRLLDHVLEVYYPYLCESVDPDLSLYGELVSRWAALAAQWMAAGFCHGVLNTDNMSITGESFDYGPWAFLDRYQPHFVAAYFDYFGRYRFENQPTICLQNLELLQEPLSAVLPRSAMDTILRPFTSHYAAIYRQLMLRRFGLKSGLEDCNGDDLIELSLQLLREAPVGYSEFFSHLRYQFQPIWREEITAIPASLFAPLHPLQESLLPLWERWRDRYHLLLNQQSSTELDHVQQRLKRYNPSIAPTRSVIEAVWDPILYADNWEPFHSLIVQLRNSPISASANDALNARSNHS
jgi:serine/tyrosine/threonine adenylyltransferase